MLMRIFDPGCLSKKYFEFGEEYRHKVAPDVILWEKDTFLFPQKINGKFAMLHRVMPGVQLVTFDRFEELQDPLFWTNHLSNLCSHIVLEPQAWFESLLIGGGAPPIETEFGWLLVYHAVEADTHTYRAGAALLDAHNPLKVLGRLQEPLFAPTEEWEKKGVVGNVVFPTSLIDEGERYAVYYGAADSFIGCKTFDKKALLDLLLKH
jgi:beta-1,2-mannobiose phosphorylase / 1,2-beta-oligomannan phosphorylase